MSQNIWPQYRDAITGVWSLVSFHVFNGKGELVRSPHGDSPLGRVQVSRDGYLSAHLSFPDRVDQARKTDQEWKARSDEEIAYFSKGISMYCGQMELYEDDKGLVWRTTVDVSSDPTRNGGIQERRVSLSKEGDVQFMTLRPVWQNDTSGEQAVLKWTKIQ